MILTYIISFGGIDLFKIALNLPGTNINLYLIGQTVNEILLTTHTFSGSNLSE